MEAELLELDAEWTTLVNEARQLYDASGNRKWFDEVRTALQPPAVAAAPPAVAVAAAASAKGEASGLRAVKKLAVAAPTHCVMGTESFELIPANRSSIATRIAKLIVDTLADPKFTLPMRTALLRLLEAQLAPAKVPPAQSWEAALEAGHRSAGDLCALWTLLQITIDNVRLGKTALRLEGVAVVGKREVVAAAAAGRVRPAKARPIAELGPYLNRCGVELVPGDAAASALAASAGAWNLAFKDLELRPVSVAALLARDEKSLRKDAPYTAFNRLQAGQGAVAVVSTRLWARWQIALDRLRSERAKPAPAPELLAVQNASMAVLNEPVGVPLTAEMTASNIRCQLGDTALTYSDSVIVRTRLRFGPNMDTVGADQFARLIGTPTRWFQPIAGGPRRPFRAYFFTVSQVVAMINLVRWLRRLELVYGAFGQPAGLTNIFVDADAPPLGGGFPMPSFLGLDAVLGVDLAPAADPKQPKIKAPLLRPSDPSKILGRDPLGASQCLVDLVPPTPDAHLFDLLALESLLLDTPTLIGPDAFNPLGGRSPADVMLFQGFGPALIPPALRTGPMPGIYASCGRDDFDALRRRFLLNAQYKVLAYFCPLYAPQRSITCLPVLSAQDWDLIQLVVPSANGVAIAHWRPPDQWAFTTKADGSLGPSFTRIPVPAADQPTWLKSNNNNNGPCAASAWLQMLLNPATLLSSVSADVRRAVFVLTPPESRQQCLLRSISASVGSARVYALPLSVGATLYAAFARSSQPVRVPGDQRSWRIWDVDHVLRPGSAPDTKVLPPGLLVHIGVDSSLLAIVETIQGPLSKVKVPADNPKDGDRELLVPSPQHVVLWQTTVPIGYRAAAQKIAGLTWEAMLAQAGTRAIDPTAGLTPTPAVANIELQLARSVFLPLARYTLNVLRSSRLNKTLTTAYLLSLWPSVARQAFEDPLNASDKSLELIPLLALANSAPTAAAAAPTFILRPAASADDALMTPAAGWIIGLMAMLADSPLSGFCFPNS